MYDGMTYVDPRDPNTIWIHRDEILKRLGVTIYEQMTRAYLRAGMNVTVVPSLERWPWRGRNGHAGL